ncbi:MAG: DNA-3-methyladenine glycosylase 2 family protein [Lachnospiraceae bacterium]|nr:DNA-3-methyladenine glycosylase 2 family protein [Lachnospiraceae bacterium]
MRIFNEGDCVIVEDVSEFDIRQTLECGQCFHFEKLDEMDYAVVYKKHLLRIKQNGNVLKCENTSVEEFENVWKYYFDLDRDYKCIQEDLISADERLLEAIKENRGVRILNQDFAETLMSFIISQNKQIPHIKAIVKSLSEKYGDYLGSINGMDFYAFPDELQIKKISEEMYRECKTGFRAPYLFDAGVKLNSEDFNSEGLRNMGYDLAKEKLITIKGVGEKVANCVLLFALGYRNAFPVDVWIKRIMEHMYFEKETDNNEIMRFAKERFGDYGGYAQQYLFYYAREKKMK